MIINVFSVHQSQSVCVYLWFLCVSVVLSVLTDGGGGGAGSLPTHQWVKTPSPTVQVCVYNPDGAADTVISVCIVYTHTRHKRASHLHQARAFVPSSLQYERSPQTGSGMEVP